MTRNIRRGVSAMLAVALFCRVAGAHPVIPGAAGFGVETPAGRGGKIFRVTNLNDSGEGSLRQCVAATGSRICVFEVSGTIHLQSNLVIESSKITIAGQTAPGDGIMLRGASLVVKASDVLLQHLAIRAGDANDGPPADSRDSLKIIGNSSIRNIVVDHCSLSWAVDENVETYKEWSDVSILNSIISEPLRSSISSTGSHGYGSLIDTTHTGSRISLVGNLFAHAHARNPMTSASEFVFVNNVVYNPGAAAVMLYNHDGMFSKNSIVGNVFIDGPDSSAPAVRLFGPGYGEEGYEILPETRIFLADNWVNDSSVDDWSIVDSKSDLSISLLKALVEPTWPSNLGAISTKNGAVLEYVLANAGHRPAARDVVDARIVAHVKSRSGRIVDCVSSDGPTGCSNNAGGWPTLQRVTHSLSIPSNPHADDDGDGYTNVEEWLHAMAATVEGRSGLSGSEEAAPPKPPILGD